ncbi:uncharacterized protein PV09_08492 [Verruconis gallopava]|uniref:RTA1-domain-containing protein n=1 Tax=Verruconis gallopava TaxID=253628 RepID=A0A0D1YGA2_9PEZI|nr:uncharacterized protein PV09_08492 [Verruconis gallopava]KIV99821.1 hypothetical protein PV09_08492 [Verruconis gallopava]
MPIADFEGCKAYEPGKADLYGYKPELAAGIVFSVLFFISMVAHFVQGWMKRTWWTAVFAVGALTELIGWAGRTWSSQCPSNLNAFLMQICTLIIGPTFFTAGIYVILGRLINLTGGKGKTSIISSRMYLFIFCTCDVISLVIQAIGGAQASAAVSATPPRRSKTGTNIMVGGIVFQMASITVFAFFFVDFLRRAVKLGTGILTRDIKTLIWATTFSGALIYVRSIYRTVELAQGWTGYLITHEGYFLGFDGALMILAVAVFNFAHPGWLLPRSLAMQEKSSASSTRESEADGFYETSRA